MEMGVGGGKWEVGEGGGRGTICTGKVESLNE